MKKERRKKKKQRNSSTASSDSSNLKSPVSSTTATDYESQSFQRFLLLLLFSWELVLKYGRVQRNISVDSEGYSVKPVEDANRERNSSFYSSSEDESDDDGATNNFAGGSAAGGSSLKFSIRPPSMNLAPSMEDLSNSARSLTLEKSPRPMRRGNNGTSAQNPNNNEL